MGSKIMFHGILSLENNSKFLPAKIGGHYNIRRNFDKQSIIPNIPKFYRTCLYTWSNYTNKNPENVNEICIQPIWNNSKILVNKK